jgi:glutathione reductase (NADPH)
MSDFDLVIVGTGSAGTSAALRCAGAGLRVAIADERPYGGTCALRGCDPKKVLVGAAELIEWADRMRDYGVAGNARIDWPALMRFKHSFTDPVPPEREAAYRQSGIATYHGRARFADPKTIEISDQPLRANYFLVAAGARPAELHLAGEEHLITSTEFLNLERLPRRIAFIGGGYIAFEFAHVAVRAQAAPVILQRGPRVLTGFEPTLVDQLVEVSRNLGIDVRVDVNVSAIEKRPGGFRVCATNGANEFAVECDLVVHAAGRVADLDHLGLETGAIERTKKGVAVNEFLQSSNPSVYAAGDCADGGGLALTPTAAAQGEVVARNLIDGNQHAVDFAGLASIVYTIPPLGTTGLTQAQAAQRGLRFTVHAGDSTQWYSSRRIRARRSAYRILVEEETGFILGAHILGPHTEELINVFSLAIRTKLTAEQLKDVLFGYPTASSDISDMLA